MWNLKIKEIKIDNAWVYMYMKMIGSALGAGSIKVQMFVLLCMCQLVWLLQKLCFSHELHCALRSNYDIVNHIELIEITYIYIWRISIHLNGNMLWYMTNDKYNQLLPFIQSNVIISIVWFQYCTLLIVKWKFENFPKFALNSLFPEIQHNNNNRLYFIINQKVKTIQIN